MKDLYIIGAGGFGREVLWLVKRINAMNPTWNIKGFIDDDTKMSGKQCNEYPVCGGCDYLKSIEKDIWIVYAVGSSKIKMTLDRKFSEIKNIHFATLIDPSVIMSDRVCIGEGTIICAGTILTTDIELGRHVTLNLDCTIGHDVKISDYTTVYPSVNISGNVSVDYAVELGTGSHIIQGKHIGEQSIIGAGTVVIRDIPSRCTAVGNPARIL